MTYEEVEEKIRAWEAKGKPEATLVLKYGRAITCPPIPQSCKHLHIEKCTFKSLPELPAKLEYLLVTECPRITDLPPLPDTLRTLSIPKMSITKLPAILPPNLIYLCITHTPIEHIPDLPDTLYWLYMGHTPVRVIPKLPKKLEFFWADPCPNLLIPMPKCHPIYLVEQTRWRWDSYHKEDRSRRRIQERCRTIKEDLMAEVFHPRRVAERLERYGAEALEAW